MNVDAVGDEEEEAAEDAFRPQGTTDAGAATAGEEDEGTAIELKPSIVTTG